MHFPLNIVPVRPTQRRPEPPPPGDSAQLSWYRVRATSDGFQVCNIRGDELMRSADWETVLRRLGFVGERPPASARPPAPPEPRASALPGPPAPGERVEVGRGIAERHPADAPDLAIRFLLRDRSGTVIAAARDWDGLLRVAGAAPPLPRLERWAKHVRAWGDKGHRKALAEYEARHGPIAVSYVWREPGVPDLATGPAPETPVAPPPAPPAEEPQVGLALERPKASEPVLDVIDREADPAELRRRAAAGFLIASGFNVVAEASTIEEADEQRAILKRWTGLKGYSVLWADTRSRVSRAQGRIIRGS